MCIKNELSSDIAVALLARGENDPERLQEMKDLIFRIHATLQGQNERSEKTPTRVRAAGANASPPVENQR